MSCRERHSPEWRVFLGKIALVHVKFLADVNTVSFRAEWAEFFLRVLSSNASACAVEVLFGIARFLRDESLPPQTWLIPVLASAKNPLAPCNRQEAYNFFMDRSKLLVVDRFASQVEADLAKSALESAGIDAVIQADTAGGMRPHIAWSGLGFKVLVREEDAETAREVLHPPQDMSAETTLPDGEDSAASKPSN